MKKKIRIRIALIILILMLIILAMFPIIAIMSYNNYTLALDIQSARIGSIFKESTTRLEKNFLHAPEILDKYTKYIADQSLSIQDPAILGRYLANELRTEPELSWISFGGAEDGRFIGATRRDGKIIINMSVPRLRGGATTEWELTAAGQMIPVKVNNTAPYDARAQSWFKLGMSHDGVSWSQPYAFREGGYGITAVKQVRLPYQRAALGVMTVDFSFHAIDQTLRVMSEESAGELLLALTIDQHLFITGRPGPVLDHLKQQLSLADPTTGEISLSAINNDLVAFKHPVKLVGDIHANLIYLVDSRLTAYGRVKAQTIRTVLASLVFLGLSILAALAISYSIARPIERIGKWANNISFDNLGSVNVLPHHWLRELDNSAAAFNRMIDRLNQEERVRSTFGRYIPDELAKAITAGTVNIDLGGHESELTMLFTDVESFTATAETLPADQLIDVMNRYFELILAEIQAAEGMVIDFIGDGLFAVFGAPIARPDHRDMGIRCALRVVERTCALKETLAAEGITWGRTRMGLHSGRVIAGNVGGPGRQKYTALGDPVNATSRIESLNKQLGTRMLASAATVGSSTLDVCWRPVGRFQLVGKKEPLELFGFMEQVFDEARLQQFRDCLAALGDDEAKPDAKTLFRQYLDTHGDDPVARFHLDRLMAGETGDMVILSKK